MRVFDAAISPVEKMAMLRPAILLCALIAAAIAVSVVLIAKLAKKKR